MDFAKVAFIAAIAWFFFALTSADTQATMICTGDVTADTVDGKVCGHSSASNVFVGGDFDAAGTGTLTINGGSVLTSPAPGPQGRIATESGSTGSVTLTGPGSQWILTGIFANGDVDDGSGAFLSVGRDGTGALNVKDGASVVIDAGPSGVPTTGGPGILVGGTAGGQGIGHGSILVDGANSKIDISCALCQTDDNGPFATIGRGGVGGMTVQSGGELSIVGLGASLAVGAGGPPSGITPLGTLDVRDGGIVTLSGEDANFTIGRNVGSTGEVTIEENSQVTVTGSDARIFVARDGEGTLQILSGSTVLVQSTDTVDTGVQISDDRDGDGKAQNGTLTVDDAQLTVNAIDAFINVGRDGVGEMTVQNGGIVSIEGTGGFGFLGVGRSGKGTLNVLTGGQVNVSDTGGASDVFVAQESGSEGLVVVDGNGSMLDAGSLLAIGFDFDLATPGGTGTVSVRNGGVIKATETHIGPNGFLGGNGTVMGSVFNDGGFFDPGLSPGTIHVTDNYTQTDGALQIQVAGLGAGEFDVLDVDGTAHFRGGSILFIFLDGFAPKTGDSFDFLSADSIEGLDNVDFLIKGLAAGFEFGVQNTGSGLQFIAQNDAIPASEPSGIAMFAVGLIGLFVCRRRYWRVSQ